jgi:K+-sensing histidine kinase KdpD
MLQAVPAETRKRVPEFTRVKACRVGSGIVDFVREEDIDLIVMSTHARKGVPRLFLGSIAERVIREAPCPVITVRPRAVLSRRLLRSDREKQDEAPKRTDLPSPVSTRRLFQRCRW